MKLHPRVSRSLVERTKRFEGFRRRAAPLPSGAWTLGYGHVRTAREGASVSAEDAEALLYYDLSEVAEKVEAWTFAPLNQNQFEAFTAFAFNIGVDNFRVSTALKRFNEGQPLAAAEALELWRRAEIGGEDLVVDALVRRRALEKALFLTPPEGFRPSPTPVLAPLFDRDPLSRRLEEPQRLPAAPHPVDTSAEDTAPSAMDASESREADAALDGGRADQTLLEAPLPELPLLERATGEAAPEQAATTTLQEPVDADVAPRSAPYDASSSASFDASSEALLDPSTQDAAVSATAPVGSATTREGDAASSAGVSPKTFGTAPNDAAGDLSPLTPELAAAESRTPSREDGGSEDRALRRRDFVAAEDAGLDKAFDDRIGADRSAPEGSPRPEPAASSAALSASEAAAARRRRGAQARTAALFLIAGVIGFVLVVVASVAVTTGQASVASLVTGGLGVIGLTIGFGGFMLRSRSPA
jgi:GH24 family phage-related lysozyme (muramidase)